MSSNIASWLRESITAKFVVIGFLSLILLIPAAIIRELVQERQRTSLEVYNEVSAKWGRQQTLSGPVLTIPFKKEYTDNDGKIKTFKKYAYFLPVTLDLKGNINPEIRKRGVHKAIVYSSALQFSGKFTSPSFEELNIAEEDVYWGEAFIALGISDMKGINKTIQFSLNNSTHEVTPGLSSRHMIKSGLSVPLAFSKKDFEKPLKYNFTVDINGSEKLWFMPLGKTTTVDLESDWESPKFNGEFLPDEHSVNESGFTAQWEILNVNRNYPQQWEDNEYSINQSAFGVDLIIPVDHYLKSERSVKYAFMFIGLTFMVFFFCELLYKKQVHLVQYILIGFALCVFYTLLLSLSEHIGFSWAYFVSALAIVLLISSFSRSVLGEKKLTLSVFATLLALYIFLYTLLQLENYALMMGSIGLFIAIALFMKASSKVNWFKSLGKEEDET